MPKDYYSILGVDKNSTEEEIKRAYKTQAKKWHPDLNKDSGASDKFKEINEAAAVLGNAEKRKHYDQYGTSEGPTGFEGFDPRGEGFDFENIFDSFFRGFGGSRNSNGGPERGRDLLYDLDITLEEAYKGLTKTVQFEKYDTCTLCKGKGGEGFTTCNTCKGRGQVQRTQRTPFGIFATTTTCPTCRGEGEAIEKPCDNCDGAGRLEIDKKIDIAIPAGVDNGTRLRVRNEGEAGERGTKTGDLYVTIHVREHKQFKRQGQDLFVEITVPFTTACLGGEVEVPTLDGNETIELPESTQPNTIFRLKHKGMPGIHAGKGSLHATVHVEIPKKLNKKQKELIKEFENATKKGWFG
ncbi:MAG: molecular chaperone DnaJ [Candidatus Woesearchaeota archaeon]|nr:molecular chaperone DnaJ [Candidatus Woesearchaeota archaeon]